MSNTTGRKWEMRYIQRIQFQEQLEGKTMEPENSYQKLTTKYPAPKARKRDVAKKTTKTKHRPKSIIVIEEIVIVTRDMS
jgi:hypothetical protein